MSSDTECGVAIFVAAGLWFWLYFKVRDLLHNR